VAWLPGHADGGSDPPERPRKRAGRCERRSFVCVPERLTHGALGLRALRGNWPAGKRPNLTIYS